VPPADELWHYGGEIYVGYEDGSVAYQDAFGRSSPASDAHAKSVNEAKLGVNDPCGCGSGKKYKKCCKAKSKALRPSWSVRSIRERNIAFYREISDILGLNKGKDWNDVRRELDEEKVKDIHALHGALRPIETDIFDLLPKPDGDGRALYAGLLDPRTAPFSIASACLYFGTVLVQNPFMCPLSLLG
jgi:SEC-C motif